MMLDKTCRNTDLEGKRLNRSTANWLEYVDRSDLVRWAGQFMVAMRNRSVDHVGCRSKLRRRWRGDVENALLSMDFWRP